MAMMIPFLYKRILQKLPTAIIVFNEKGKVVYTNEAFDAQFPGVLPRKAKTKEAKMCVIHNATQWTLFFRRIANSKTAQGATLRLFAMDADGNVPKEASLSVRGMALDKKYCMGLVESVYEQELARELTGAQNIQQRLLPSGKEAGGVPYSYMYIPCREIGGDLPDVYELDGDGATRDTFGVIADVSGKGIAAGMLSSFFKAGFDRTEPSPAKAIAKLNVKFHELNQDEKAYITVAAVRIDSDRRKIYYSIAGHNAPILLKSGQNVSEIEMAAPPVSNWFDDFSYEDREFSYEKKDILVLLTDGVTESKNAAGELFGVERVENVLMQCNTAQQFIDALRSALSEFCGTFDDDITAIAFDL
jgi:sigma-B regulation protein RsbU (phosphoserine phosphatase)